MSKFGLELGLMTIFADSGLSGFDTQKLELGSGFEKVGNFYIEYQLNQVVKQVSFFSMFAQFLLFSMPAILNGS